ncbi:hypothetical protein DFH09DRAFT_144098 [Mycena vulgaris]|nr:hypothetical protein DFH09DRAFT_144098 [Mycena vulgaris]
MRSFAGNFGHAYIVRVISQLSGQETLEKYVQFLGEICSEDGLDSEKKPCASVEVCAKMRRIANSIYTRLQEPGEIFGIPNKDLWIPAEVVAWTDGQDVDIFVMSLAGPTQGKKFFVKDVLPYNMDTAIACRKQGQNVMGPDGKLFLLDMPPVKPLKGLSPTLPKSIFNFPSPSVTLAKPVLRCIPPPSKR